MCQDSKGGLEAAGVGQEVEEKEEVFSGPGSKNANGLFGLSAAFFHRLDGPLRGRVKKLIFFVADAPYQNKLECLSLASLSIHILTDVKVLGNTFTLVIVYLSFYEINIHNLFSKRSSLI